MPVHNPCPGTSKIQAREREAYTPSYTPNIRSPAGTLGRHPFQPWKGRASKESSAGRSMALCIDPCMIPRRDIILQGPRSKQTRVSIIISFVFCLLALFLMNICKEKHMPIIYCIINVAILAILFRIKIAIHFLSGK